MATFNDGPRDGLKLYRYRPTTNEFVLSPFKQFLKKVPFGRALPVAERVAPLLRVNPLVGDFLLAWEFGRGLGEIITYFIPGGSPDPVEYNNPVNWDLDGWLVNEPRDLFYPTDPGAYPYVPDWDPSTRYSIVGTDFKWTWQHNLSEPFNPIQGFGAVWTERFADFSTAVIEISEAGVPDGFGHAIEALAERIAPGGLNGPTNFTDVSYVYQLGATTDYVGPGGGSDTLVAMPLMFEDPNAWRRGVGTTLVVDEPVVDDDLERLRTALVVGPANAPDIIRATTPEPPKTRVRERKVMTRGKKMAVALFKALDHISETAEIVDALYQALPKDVRDRWEKDRGAHWAKVDGRWKKVGLSRGLIDNAGQYGIAGADWKLQALWHNWHKLDVRQAVKNIIANEIQDRVLGQFYKHLPKQSGHAFDEAFKRVNKVQDAAVQEAFRQLGI